MTSENGVMYMPVAPAYGAGNAGGMGLDGFGGGWGLLILLLVLGRGGLWGGNCDSGNSMLPWILGSQNNSNNDVQRGFDQSAIINGINGISAGLANGFAQAEISANARQMADMNQNFSIQSALQNCCCQQSANTADLKYTVATTARDIIDNDNRNHQATMDKLCQLELDGVRQQLANEQRANNDLRTQLLVLQGQASQNAQTAQILANNEAQTTTLEQYLAPTPRPAYIVQNPACCNQNFGFGCGCGN